MQGGRARTVAEVQGVENVLVEQDDGGREGDPCSVVGELAMFARSSTRRYQFKNVRDVDCRVD